jgi:hypothetical protein
MANNLLEDGKGLVLNALKNEVNSIRLYGVRSYYLPNGAKETMAYETEIKTLTFSSPIQANGAFTGLMAMSQANIVFNLIEGQDFLGLEDEEIRLSGANLIKDTGSEEISYVLAAFSPVSYRTIGDFTLTDLTIRVS